tara:strand:+ start:598 stop:792 length:195 start_codon:yes stop_codon:yes gene_type:complete
MTKQLLIGRDDLIKLLGNQGEHKQFYIEVGDNVVINFKHIRPRNRKRDRIRPFHQDSGTTLYFD